MVRVTRAAVKVPRKGTVVNDPLIMTVGDVVQVCRDAERFGRDAAVVLAIVRHGRNLLPLARLTVRGIADMTGMSEADTLSTVDDLVDAKRLVWTMLGSTRVESRVRAL
jgi:hypothetical protein